MRQTVAAKTNGTPVRAGSTMSRTCACGTHTGGGQCDHCKAQTHSRAALIPAGNAEGRLQKSGTAGSPMPAEMRSDMEHRFGADFASVRLHTDKAAAESADALNAKAYTIGNDIVFNTGQFAPAQSDGQWLLAHELAHVVQQSRGGEAPTLDPRGANEQAANAAAVQSATGDGPVAVDGSSGVGIARQIDDEEPAPREETQDRLVTIEVVDTSPETSAEIRSVLESEYVPTAAQAKELKARDPNFNFSGRASIDRGNAYERTIRDAINSGELSHPLLSRERGVPRARVAPAHGEPFERELTRGERAQGRILDVGWSVEITVEGGSTGFLSQNKITQIARDLRNSGESVLIVPEMTPGIEKQLAELTTKAESEIGGEPRVHVLIVNGAPAEPWALPETLAPTSPPPSTPPSSAASPKPVFTAPEPVTPKSAEPIKPLAPPAAPKQAPANPNVIVQEQERGAGAAAGALEIANLGIKTTQETKAHQLVRRDSALRTWAWWSEKGVFPAARVVVDNWLEPDDITPVLPHTLASVGPFDGLEVDGLTRPDLFEAFANWARATLHTFDDYIRYFVQVLDPGVRRNGTTWEVQTWRWDDDWPAASFSEWQPDTRVTALMEPIYQQMVTQTVQDIADFAQNRRWAPQGHVVGPRWIRHDFGVSKALFSPTQPTVPLLFNVLIDAPFEPMFLLLEDPNVPAHMSLVMGGDFRTHVLLRDTMVWVEKEGASISTSGGRSGELRPNVRAIALVETDALTDVDPSQRK